MLLHRRMAKLYLETNQNTNRPIQSYANYAYEY